MKRIIQILNKTQFGFLATIDENMPRVRPFQFQFEDDKKFYFCTSKEKRVVEQLKNNPIIEYSAFNKTFDYVRLSGRVIFSEEVRLKEKVFELNPYYKEKFVIPRNSNMVLFYLEHGTAELGSFETYPPEVIQF